MTSPLLLRPTVTRGLVHHVMPESAGWGYVGFELHRLLPGDGASGAMGDRKAILMLVEGRARQVRSRHWGAEVFLTVTAIVTEMGPGLFAAFRQVDSLAHYEAPAIQPNGDILIRRSESAPDWTPPAAP